MVRTPSDMARTKFLLNTNFRSFSRILFKKLKRRTVAAFRLYISLDTLYRKLGSTAPTIYTRSDITTSRTHTDTSQSSNAGYFDVRGLGEFSIYFSYIVMSFAVFRRIRCIDSVLGNRGTLGTRWKRCKYHDLMAAFTLSIISLPVQIDSAPTCVPQKLVAR